MSTVKKTIKSSWTPLSNEDTNNKIFDERCQLVNKWFDKWTDEQRKRILESLLVRCKPGQAEHAVDFVRSRVPLQRLDFTRALPRVISLYIFSFLDPRSLCRSAQVCWYWKYLAEADEIWMPKSARLGWFMAPEEYLLLNPDPLSPSNLWKRFYLSKIQELQVQRPNMDALVEELSAIKITEEAAEKHATARRSRRTLPWRGPDPRPIDTWRNNYLQNDDEIEKSRKIRSLTSTRPSSRTRPKSAKSSDPNRTTKIISTTGRLQTEVVDSNKTTDGLSATRRHNQSGNHPGISAPTTPVVPATSYPRPAAPMALKVRNRSPDRTERDPPSSELFKATSTMESLPPPAVTPSY